MNTPLSLLGQLHTARVVGALPATWQRVHTDSRSVRPGDVFVALRGERFDGHDFLPQLPTLGVHAALAEHGLA
ncbi:MAG: Mur ligase domain-containing protein, partial [Burkholderiaceae bacterium]